MSTPLLDPTQEQRAQELHQRWLARFSEESLALARLLVSKDDDQLLGATEYEVRDRVHRLGADALEAALQERKKGGTAVRP